MDVTETPQPLAATEAALSQPLSDEAGWNQRPEDWRMMLDRGQGFTIRDGAGMPRATALALPMGKQFGWISMVLVTKALRRRGYAKRLMRTCVDWLEARELVPFLDATPAGQSLYAQMGFSGTLRLRRMAGTGGGAIPMEELRAARIEDLDWIAALDREVFGGDRAFVLRDLLTRTGAVALVREARDGFVLSRAGCSATQIGPVIAPSTRVAETLLTAALANLSGPVFIDATAEAGLAETLVARGFTEQRPFLRMARGAAGQIGTPARYFAAAGPELG